MEQFKATVMNWAPLYESPVTEASNWCQLAHHSELVSPMAKEKGNGQRWILLATVSLSNMGVVPFLKIVLRSERTGSFLIV